MIHNLALNGIHGTCRKQRPQSTQPVSFYATSLSSSLINSPSAIISVSPLCFSSMMVSFYTWIICWLSPSSWPWSCLAPSQSAQASSSFVATSGPRKRLCFVIEDYVVHANHNRYAISNRFRIDSWLKKRELWFTDFPSAALSFPQSQLGKLRQRWGMKHLLQGPTQWSDQNLSPWPYDPKSAT